ncbi:flavodoxin-dependent (E)-4-hydroxy-3-methylbut-2-enyl-diphosphate synthase [Candidatus Neoehrlichia procyonis]|uniref:4-hydroxy-3-methylbut-2-en-1-yl diphosphate synthase n=1 Tax=Candidatus Neoehrlichia procyonis str. RAC413 TaxID=1359163 RepID=A0A0F3NPS0_9RICK|nr:flavodoxin-dependent (E)-4-hydroxy-3-methylbut-2-enyl-diphosphate synthase [Candidatus Neoehrlichia lotoris]KJV68919.1 4-hydroxy-3-methylbut-2-en-1-yl diphosphate synthase [Candidatus Neoehrlichia lotoris str. RAC413]
MKFSCESIDDFLDKFYDNSIVVRKKTHEVKVGNVSIGGENPIVVQSMALGGSDDANNAQEVVELAKAGSELVRVAINSDKAIKAIPYIRDQLVKNGFDSKMIVGCGQYEVARLLNDYPECAAALGKIRINPGNIGFGDKRDKNFEQVIEYAIKYDIPIRIGVNWGSLDKHLLSELMDKNAALSNPKPDYFILRKALIISSLFSAYRAESIGLPANKIVVSCKSSSIKDLIYIYTALSQLSNYALHLGLTEAGSGLSGIVSSVAGISPLLLRGIGDTIRVSLTSTAIESRVNEIKVCQEILQSIGLRYFSARVTSCPGCNRTNPLYFQKLVTEVNDYISERMTTWKANYHGVEHMIVAVMGCIVNGPGESKHANLGISLPGSGERPVAVVYENGKKLCTIQDKENIFTKFKDIIDSYVARHYNN